MQGQNIMLAPAEGKQMALKPFAGEFLPPSQGSPIFDQEPSQRPIARFQPFSDRLDLC